MAVADFLLRHSEQGEGGGGNREGVGCRPWPEAGGGDMCREGGVTWAQSHFYPLPPPPLF